MLKDFTFKKEVLQEALKMTTASVLIAISNSCKNREKLVKYTNYYVAIALKSFYLYCNTGKEYESKDFALKEFKLIYTECFSNAYVNYDDLKDYFAFKDEYKELDTDEKVIIMAILMLSSFYGTKSINKIKNILRTYLMKLRNTLKNSNKYYDLFKDSFYDKEFKIKCKLFCFLIENS